MEAKKLKKTKGTISKGKIKKTIKNIICRPDPDFWPAVSESEKISLEEILENYRVEIPKFTKPHWNEIKLLPKNERPKAPEIEQVNGLIFGLSNCRRSIQSKECSAVIIEALINPQTIVQPCINECVKANIPVVCLKNLKILTKTYFGIQTICLGVEKDCLLELHNKIQEISINYKPKVRNIPKISSDAKILECVKDEIAPMEVDVTVPNPYLYRNNKKRRIFLPFETVFNKKKNQFAGQQFIELSKTSVIKSDSKGYMKMMLKRMSNNSNRDQLKKKS